MTARMRDLLANELEEAFRYVRERVDGLTDEEFFWEPVPGWSVRRWDRKGATSPFARYLATYGGDRSWFSDESWDGTRFLDLEPSPFTTIGWRLVHLGSCKVMYYEHAFGERRDLWAKLVGIHTAADAIAQLEEGHRLLAEELATLSDARLDGTSLTNWGEEWPTWRIFTTMIRHDFQHGAEIGCVRDLYAHRDALRPDEI